MSKNIKTLVNKANEQIQKVEKLLKETEELVEKENGEGNLKEIDEKMKLYEKDIKTIKTKFRKANNKDAVNKVNEELTKLRQNINSEKKRIDEYKKEKVDKYSKNKIKWEITIDVMMIIGKYFKENNDYINVMRVCKRYCELAKMYHFNPIDDCQLFENMQTQQFYTGGEKGKVGKG